MKQHQLNSVFLDTENFDTPKRLKCVEDTNGGFEVCRLCAYQENCSSVQCSSFFRRDAKPVFFIQTDEPLTTE